MQEVKLDEIISKLKKYPNLFRLREQENKNVSQYFSTFNQKYLPNDFIEYMNIFDGLSTEIFTIFSINDSDEEIILTFNEYSSKDITKNYLKYVNFKDNSNIFFFACDNKLGRYYFRTDEQDSAVYYMNFNTPSMFEKYDSFLDLLNIKIDEYISIKS